jgi:competence protein ComEC
VQSIGTIPAMAILAGALGGLLSEITAALPATALVVFTTIAWVAWWRHRDRMTLGATMMAFVCAAAALAGDAQHRALHVSLAPLTSIGAGPLRDPVAVRVRLLEDGSPQAGFTMLQADVTAVGRDGGWEPANAGVTMTVGGSVAAEQSGEWRAGRIVETFATFRRPARYLDEGVPDFERDLALAGTALFGSVKSGLLVDVRARGTRVEEAAAGIRAHVRRSVQRWVAPHDAVAAAIVTAVLIGDRTGLPDEVRLRLQAAGTYHVIAISGGNIAILAGLVLGLLLVCGISGRPAACITLLLLVAYAQVVSAGASVWRATLMAILYLGARLLDHRSPPWHALAAAAAIVICARPLDVRDAGFLLTFGATAALLEAARRVTAASLIGVKGSWQRAGNWLLASLAASLAVEIALLPLSAWTFSRVTSAGLVLNLAAVPLMALVQIGGIVVSCLADVEILARPAGWIAYAGAASLVGSARLVEIAPWLTARVPPPSLVVVAAYYAGLAAALLGTGLRSGENGATVRWCGGAGVRGCGGAGVRWCGSAAVLVSTLAIVTGQPAGWLSDAAAPGRLRVTMFDVGQGDATLVELPDRSRVLIDAGGTPFGTSTFDIGSRVLAPALWARGLRRIDALLVTHGDPDHIGGAGAVIDDFGPDALWEGVPVLRHRPLQEVLRKASAVGVRVERRHAGDRWRAGAARVRVLHPPIPDWERPQVRNDDSVVLEIVYGDVAVLLLGDVGAGVERSILAQLTPAPHRILKVGHHGSRTSTSQELLDHWRPQIALISCGRGNTFGHPAPEVLRRLESIGARIYRTDLDGQVTIDTDGIHVNSRTFNETNR